jgi:hypothetical protein
VTPGGRYSLEFGVQVAVQKFLDHLRGTRCGCCAATCCRRFSRCGSCGA